MSPALLFEVLEPENMIDYEIFEESVPFTNGKVTYAVILGWKSNVNPQTNADVWTLASPQAVVSSERLGTFASSDTPQAWTITDPIDISGTPDAGTVGLQNNTITPGPSTGTRSLFFPKTRILVPPRWKFDISVGSLKNCYGLYCRTLKLAVLAL